LNPLSLNFKIGFPKALFLDNDIGYKNADYMLITTQVGSTPGEINVVICSGNWTIIRLKWTVN